MKMQLTEGWIHSNLIFADNCNREQERRKCCRCSWNRGKNHLIPVPGSIIAAFFNFGDCLAKYRRKKTGACGKNFVLRNTDWFLRRTCFRSSVPVFCQECHRAVYYKHGSCTLWLPIYKNLRI